MTECVTEDFARFSYTFDFDGIELIYQYTRFSNQELRSEELIINGVSIFKCDFLNKDYCFVKDLEDFLNAMDLDTALRNLPLTEEQISAALGSICTIDLNDEVSFEIKSVAPIRKDDGTDTDFVGSK